MTTGRGVWRRFGLFRVRGDARRAQVPQIIVPPFSLTGSQEGGGGQRQPAAANGLSVEPNPTQATIDQKITAGGLTPAPGGQVSGAPVSPDVVQSSVFDAPGALRVRVRRGSF